MAPHTMPTLTTFTCTFCRLSLSSKPAARSFMTSASRKAVPPESPHYVDVPQSYQPDLFIPRRPKGILPVPKKLFPANQPDKASPAYLARVTPDAKPANAVPESKMTPLGAHRHRMASLRKSHLRSGLQELHKRKVSMRRQINFRSAAKTSQSERLRFQPMREDERLTNTSIPQAMLPANIQHTTPEDALDIHLSKLHRVQAARAQRDKDDQYAVHALYMNARNFITTEAQLLSSIDDKFVPGPLNEDWTGSHLQTGENIWNRGAPPTVNQMINDQSVSRRGPASSTTKYKKDQERMKRIAEELSGGKI